MSFFFIAKCIIMILNIISSGFHAIQDVRQATWNQSQIGLDLNIRSTSSLVSWIFERSAWMDLRCVCLRQQQDFVFLMKVSNITCFCETHAVNVWFTSYHLTFLWIADVCGYDVWKISSMPLSFCAVTPGILTLTNCFMRFRSCSS